LRRTVSGIALTFLAVSLLVFASKVQPVKYVGDFYNGREGSPRDMLKRLHDMYNYFYGRRVSETYCTYNGEVYLDFIGILGLAVYLHDGNQSCLNITENALKEAYDNRNSTTGLLQGGNSEGGWETIECQYTTQILYAIGGLSTINSTFTVYYENLIKAYDDYLYDDTSKLVYSYLKSDGSQSTGKEGYCYAVYGISQPKAITMFYNAYRITGNQSWREIAGQLADAWWKTRTSADLVDHLCDADSNTTIKGWVNHYDQAATLMVFAYLVREGEDMISYDGHRFNVTEALEDCLDAYDSAFWHPLSNRWGYRASTSKGILVDSQPEMYYGSSDRAVLMACTALDNFTCIDHAKSDLISSYEALKEKSGDAQGLLHTLSVTLVIFVSDKILFSLKPATCSIINTVIQL